MKKNSQKNLKMSAFTMIELVFIVVVIGVLAAVIIPKTKTNPLQEAAIQLLSHIRYTQHLALVNDTYNPNRKDNSGSVIWYKDRWQLVFSNSDFSDNSIAYTIFSDNFGTAVNRGDAQESEIAINPQNRAQIMTGGYGVAQAINYNHPNFKGMREMNLGKTYGVSSQKLEGGCSGARISFDHLGRPFRGDQSSMSGPYQASTQRLITQKCRIRLSNGSDDIFISISPETGYACISDEQSNCL